MIPEAMGVIPGREGGIGPLAEETRTKNISKTVGRRVVGSAGDLSSIYSPHSSFLNLILITHPMLSSSDRS